VFVARHSAVAVQVVERQQHRGTGVAALSGVGDEPRLAAGVGHDWQADGRENEEQQSNWRAWVPAGNRRCG